MAPGAVEAALTVAVLVPSVTLTLPRVLVPAGSGAESAVRPEADEAFEEIVIVPEPVEDTRSRSAARPAPFTRNC